MWLVTCICRYKFALNKARSEINYKLAMFLHICCFPLQPAKPLVEVLQLPVDGREVACKDLLHLLVDLELSSLISIFLIVFSLCSFTCLSVHLASNLLYTLSGPICSGALSCVVLRSTWREWGDGVLVVVGEVGIGVGTRTATCWPDSKSPEEHQYHPLSSGCAFLIRKLKGSPLSEEERLFAGLSIYWMHFPTWDGNCSWFLSCVGYLHEDANMICCQTNWEDSLPAKSRKICLDSE